MKLSFFLHILCILILTGKVVSVTDGDTLTLLTPEKKQVKVRLDGIDAPERKQPYGTEAREHLATMVFQKDVKVEVLGKDRYGRTIGKVKAGRVDVNKNMVREGYAWWYQKYAPDRVDLQKAQSLAQKERRGLWASEDGMTPKAPWDFRKKK